MKIGRRRFIGFTAGAAAGAVAGGIGGRSLRELLASAESPLAPPGGPETSVLSVCDMCPGGCGVRARRIGDRVVKLAGNPLHPVNGGRLCPRGQAALQVLYHPDRLSGPLRRVGPRGSIRSFERVSWDLALGEIAARLRALREGERADSVVLVRDGDAGLGPRLARRLLQAFGSPHDLVLHRGDEAAARALMLTQGVSSAPAPDLQSADYVLSLGSALLECFSSPVHAMRAYGEFRQGRAGHRGKLVQVEPRLSITGCSADERIAVRPGTEGVFALGVAAAIVSEGLYDREFVLEHTGGFEDATDGRGTSRRGLRSVLERHYRPGDVEEETGVPVHVTLRIAREFAAARSLAIGPRKGPLVPGRLFDHLAASVLGALTGGIDAPGGLLVPEPVPLAPWPPLPTGPSASRRERPGAAPGASPLDAERLAEAILSGEPPGVEALLLLRADPAFASAAPDLFAAAIEKVPLVVAIATFPDDTALLSDWILPEAHFLERWDLHITPPGVPYPIVSLAQPALARPLGEARPAAEIVLELARQAGPQVASALPWKGLTALVRGEMDGLFSARRGSVMGAAFDTAWARMMEDAGFWAPGYRSSDELWARSLQSGGWWDPFYDHGDWKRVLRTPSGRYEFPADLLVRPPPASSRAAALDPAPGALDLLLFEPLPVAGGTGAELPFLQAILDPGHEERWETWAELHPENAARSRIRDRDLVRIQSSRAAIVARARVTSRVVPGAVAIPVGLGKRGGGRWAAGRGANPLRLLDGARDPISGLPDFTGTRVQVSRAGGSGERT